MECLPKHSLVMNGYASPSVSSPIWEVEWIVSCSIANHCNQQNEGQPIVFEICHDTADQS